MRSDMLVLKHELWFKAYKEKVPMHLPFFPLHQSPEELGFTVMESQSAQTFIIGFPSDLEHRTLSVA